MICTLFGAAAQAQAQDRPRRACKGNGAGTVGNALPLIDGTGAAPARVVVVMGTLNPKCPTPAPATIPAANATNQGAGNSINIISGNNYQHETDMAALPGGLGLEIVRHYNSVFSKPSNPNGIVGRG